MLNNIFLISLSMSVVILLLLLTMPILNKKYTFVCRYFIWLFIAVRLLIPFKASIPQAPIRVVLPVESTAYRSVQESVYTEPSDEPEKFVSDIQSASVPNTAVKRNFSIGTNDILGFIWASGVLIFLLYHFIGYVVFKRRIKPWRNIIDDSCPKVVLCKKIKSPMLTGFFKPEILIPYETYESGDTEAVIAHEMMHYYRKDLWYKLIVIFANAVHWFNPLAYVMTYMANRDMEFSCDELVVKNKDTDFKKYYSNAILNTVQNEKTTAFSTYFKGGKNNMKQRISNIFSQNKKKTGIIAVIIMLVVVVIAGLLIAGNSGYQYENKALGFGFKLPASWDGKYIIEEDGEIVSVYNKAINDKYQKGMGLLFYINRIEGELTDEEIDNPGGRKGLINANGYTYIFGIPTDVRVPIWEDGREKDMCDEYLEMSEDLEKILRSMRAIKPDGSVPVSDITRLYEYRDTYIGDNTNVRNVFNVIEFSDFEVNSIELKTDERPYRLTVNYSVDSRANYRFFSYRSFDRTMAVLYALIPNVDEIVCMIYDDYSVIGNEETSFASAYSSRETLHERTGMEEFTEQYINDSTKLLENFTEYYNKVDSLPEYSSNGGNAKLTAIYDFIGSDCEIVTNSGISEKILVTENMADMAQITEVKKILEEVSVDVSDYIGKELEVRLYAIRNFKTNEEHLDIFVFDGNELVYSARLDVLPNIDELKDAVMEYLQ